MLLITQPGKSARINDYTVTESEWIANEFNLPQLVQNYPVQYHALLANVICRYY